MRKYPAKTCIFHEGNCTYFTVFDSRQCTAIQYLARNNCKKYNYTSGLDTV
jgi:hypothetical protein